VDRTNPNRVYFGGLYVHRSDDGGVTFPLIGTNLNVFHVDQHAFAFDPVDPAIRSRGRNRPPARERHESRR
jgi:hypothetical protein